MRVFQPSQLRRLLAFTRWIYAPLVAIFLGYAIYRGGDVVRAVAQHARVLPLLGAMLLWACLHAWTPVFTWWLLRDLGADIGYRETLRIHVSRLPARYLPGGVWHSVSRMVDLHRAGVDRAVISRLALMENAVPVGVALLAGGGCALATGLDALGVATMGGGMVILAIIPLLLRHRLLGQPRPLLLRGYARSVLASLAFWAIAASAFSCYWSAYSAGFSQMPALRVASAYLLGWAAGFASVFAPQGIGVFEAVVGVLLKNAIPVAGAALIAAGFRIVVLAADLLAFSLLQLRRWQRERNIGGH